MRSLFGGSPFQPQPFAPRPRLGLSFADLKTQWNAYAPTARTDLKDIRNELAPATTASSTATGPSSSVSAALPQTPGAPITSPTNLTPGTAFQPQPSSAMTTVLLVVGGLALAGTGAWYFYFRKH